MNQHKGFTLTELAGFLLMLGLLAAFMLPTLIGRHTQGSEMEAQTVSSVANALSWASVNNALSRTLDKTPPVILNSTTVCTVAALTPVWQSAIARQPSKFHGLAIMPTDYTITGSGDCSLDKVESVSCTITSASHAHTAVATVYCAR